MNSRNPYVHLALLLASALTLSACGGGGEATNNDVQITTPPTPPVIDPPDPAADPLDDQLSDIIDNENLTGDPTTGRDLPSIEDPLPQLGKKLFFSNNLGGEFDAACVSCHHPVLGGGDDLSLSVGVHAVDSTGTPNPELLGLGRHHQIVAGLPPVPRNAPTVFNAGLWDRGMFWDSRVESNRPTPTANGTNGGIITPDSSDTDSIDTNLPDNTSLPAAQARFPVTSPDEMRADFAPLADNQSLRSTLAARLDDISAGWPQEFIDIFDDNAINYDRIAEAIGEYERSMVFIDSPWKDYIDGDLDALTDDQKEGAALFFTSVNQGGAGCSRCHSGDRFTDERHHLVAFPQIGPGKGDDSGQGASDDFGRERVTGNNADRYHFRTPSLLNISATGPYGHAGTYMTLEQVVRHYVAPRQAVDDLFGAVNAQPFATAAGFCQLPQIARIIVESSLTCEEIYPNAYQNSVAALNRLRDGPATSDLGPTPNLNDQEINQLVAFLEGLTDPCVNDRDCLTPWILDLNNQAGYPDDSLLIGEDETGVDL